MNEQSVKKETFPLEKILAIPFADYASSQGGIPPGKYDLIGVNISGVIGVSDILDFDEEHSDTTTTFDEIFAKKVPLTAEVVVGYTTKVTDKKGYNCVIYELKGVALVPKV